VYFCFLVLDFGSNEDNRFMRRFSVPLVKVGEMVLDAQEAHHARDVLRLGPGRAIEVFDDRGGKGWGVIERCGGREVVVRVEKVEPAAAGGLRWTIASAVPKGSRADWMIEKLSELGTAAFVPLKAERSVVLPEGKGKHQRWERLAAESAKQSRRAGVMRVGELTEVARFVRELGGAGWYFSTVPGAVPVGEAMALGQRGPQAGRLNAARVEEMNFLIGPEGGWTEGEVAMFREAGVTGVSLGDTILRVETAAVAAAVLAATVLGPALAGRLAPDAPSGNNL
jgi:16S rRNA (uracil1498-N3)-methyltransferase